MTKETVYYTAEALVQRGKSNIPPEMQAGAGLIYSSPATLAYNSPGANGFGVKRAGLAIPGSVMLVISPGCCGRNTSDIPKTAAYRNRFFYLNLDETDLVTGRHLQKIPAAVGEILAFLKEKPSVVMLCTTCLDALLGTDMERVCQKAREETGAEVRPAYMYALEREGLHPPMTAIHCSLYSLLQKRKKEPRAVNLLGYFSPLSADFELPRYLSRMGVRHIRQIATGRDFEDFLRMGEANFNLVLNSEAREAAADLERRLGIPAIELSRFYGIERIRNQYAALAKALAADIEDSGDYARAQKAIAAVRNEGSLTFAVGEWVNANPFELAEALLSYGFAVAEIFGTLTAESYVYLRRIAACSPKTRIYSNQEPSMLAYREERAVEIVIGKDAAYYHPQAAAVYWNEEVQPYGYAGVSGLFAGILAAWRKKPAGTVHSKGVCA